LKKGVFCCARCYKHAAAKPSLRMIFKALVVGQRPGQGYLTVYNLFDTDYDYPGLRAFTIPARGREAIVGVRYTF
jgi:hypothetical protein